MNKASTYYAQSRHNAQNECDSLSTIEGVLRAELNILLAADSAAATLAVRMTRNQTCLQPRRPRSCPSGVCPAFDADAFDAAIAAAPSHEELLMTRVREAAQAKARLAEAKAKVVSRPRTVKAMVNVFKEDPNPDPFGGAQVSSRTATATVTTVITTTNFTTTNPITTNTTTNLTTTTTIPTAHHHHPHRPPPTSHHSRSPS